MRDDQGVARLHVRRQVVFPQPLLDVLLRQDDHEVAGLGRLGGSHHLEAVVLRLVPGLRVFAQTDHDLNAAVRQVERVGVSLAPITDHGHRLVLQEIEVAILFVQDFHL